MRASSEGTTDSPGRDHLLAAIHAASLQLQTAPWSESDVVEAFRDQVLGLGLWGGLFMLEEGGERLTVRGTAFPAPIATVLVGLEAAVGLRSDGFSLPVGQVDLFRTLLDRRQAVFLPNIRPVLEKILPAAARPVAAKIMQTFGTVPALYAPILAAGEVAGILYLAGRDLDAGSALPIQLFADHIGVALANARMYEVKEAAAQELAASEARFRNLFESQTDIIMLLDREYRIVAARNVRPLLEKEPQEVIGRTIHEVLTPDLLELRLTQLAEVHRSRRPLRVESRVIGAAGDALWLDTVITPLRFPEDEAVSFLCQSRDVTDRVHAEQALRATMAELEQLLTISPAVIFRGRPAGDYATTFVSANVTDLLGFQPQECTSDPDFWRSRIHPDDVDYVLRIHAKLFQTGHLAFEYRFRHRDGSYRWLRDTVRLVPGEHGDPPEMVGCWVDVTERKELEEELHRSQGNLAEAERIANLCSWQLDIRRNELSWSDEIYRLFGVTAEGFAGTYDAFLAAVHPDDRERVIRAVDAALYQGEPYSIDHRIIRPDGSERLVHERGKVTFNAAGKPLRMTGSVQDVTELRGAEETLKVTQFCVDSANDGIFWVRPDGGFYYVNEAACRSLGYDREELLQMRLWEIDPDYSADRFSAGWATLRAHGFGLVESVYRRKDGSTFPVEVTANYFAYRGKEYVCTAVRNISDRRREEQERLTHARRQRDALVREVHHRIKNHLQSVIGLLRRTIKDAPEGTPVVETAIGRVQSVAIVHGLQSARRSGEIRLCDLVEAISHALPRMVHIAFEACDPDHHHCPVAILEDEAVPVALILNELVTNAAKHDPEDGPPVAISVDYLPDHARVQITNHGGPLPPDFDFDAGTGLGTGLQLVKSMLPPEGVTVRFSCEGESVVTEVTLAAPVVHITLRRAAP